MTKKRHLKYNNLSIKAGDLLEYLLENSTSEWIPCVDTVRHNLGWGSHKAQTAIAELREAGYYSSELLREKGQWSGSLQTIIDPIDGSILTVPLAKRSQVSFTMLIIHRMEE